MKKNKVFLIVVVLFVLTIIGFTIHFSSKTVKPWNKKKNNILEKYKVSELTPNSAL